MKPGQPDVQTLEVEIKEVLSERDRVRAYRVYFTTRQLGQACPCRKPLPTLGECLEHCGKRKRGD